MDKEIKLSSAVHPFDPDQQRRQKKQPAEPHLASSPSLVLPSPYVSDQILRRNRSCLSSKPTGKGGDGSRSYGYSSSRRVRKTSNDFYQKDGSDQNPQSKASKVNNDSPAERKYMGKNSLDAQKRGGYRGTRSAPHSAEKSKSAQTDSVPFEVKMADFPELAGVSSGKAQPPLVQKECWGPTPTPTSPQKQTSTWKFGSRASPSQPDSQQTAKNAKPDSSTLSLGQPVVTSWANVASQPPKKPVPEDKAISSNSHMQTEEMTAQQQMGAPGKKKRKKKKKKAKDAGEDPEAKSEGAKIYQEPPKFEDEEEFPGLTLAVTGTDRLTSSRNAAKLCNEENQREVGQHQSAEQNKEKSTAAKGQKTEKVSGKKSKVPVQLDIGNMLAALEKKQQSQKPKQDTKPVILSVGGGLPVVPKQSSVQRKTPWQQDKIAHNPLDSTSPLVKKGKQREVPKAKKPTPLKKVILKEREERKQRHLMQEMDLLPENELKPANDGAEETNATETSDEFGSPAEELDDQSEFNGTSQMIKEEDEETNKDQEIVVQQTTAPVPCPINPPKIHSRKFRDYCSQMLSRDVDECVTTLLKELVRFQDRLYQKDPMKARMKRRIVMGLREVLKHLKLRKVKCVIISPNCERIQSKGGLDEAIHTIIDTCREQGVPFVFALSRKALGRCVNKAVPVSLVGIFNYDGAQDCYHKMIELSSEARKAYDLMVSSLEQTFQVESEQAVDTEDERQISNLVKKADPIPDTTQVEEPEYIKIWKKMLEKENNHKYLNFEEQLSSMHLDSEYTENTEEEKS